MRNYSVILNAASGTGKVEAESSRIVERLTAGGRLAGVTLVTRGAALPEAARRAAESGCDALIAGGGDGTVSAVAAVTAARDLPLGVLPLGTLNHFAKDLGIPLELDAALDVVLAGGVRVVDVGEVNGQLFVNNASVGVYPQVVRLRERYRNSGRGRWIAALWAVLTVLRRRPFMAVRIRTESDSLVRATPFVLVSNNPYRLAGLQTGSRESLETGRLGVYVMNAERRRGLLSLVWRLLRHGEDVEELDCLVVAAATVDTRRPAVRAAIDGEVRVLTTPLECRSRPAALRVFAP